jgi:hypothetical protein
MPAAAGATAGSDDIACSRCMDQPEQGQDVGVQQRRSHPELEECEKL